MRITLAAGLMVCAGSLALTASAFAMPAMSVGHAVKANAADNTVVQKVEFLRRRDGSVYYRRPRFNDRGPYFFAYRGYAYPYNPGYTYRLFRGELRPSDRLRRYRIAR